MTHATPAVPVLTYATSAARYHRPLHLLALLTAAATLPLIFMGGLVTTHGAGLAVPDWPNSYGYNMFLFPPSAWVGGIWYEHVHRLYATFVGFLAVTTALAAWGPSTNPSVRRWLGWSVLVVDLVTICLAALLVWHSSDNRLTEGADRHLQHVVVGVASIGLVLSVAWLARQREARRWVRWLALAVLGSVIAQGVLGGLRVVWQELDLAVVHGCFAQAFLCLAVLLAAVTGRWWINRSAESKAAAMPAPALLAIGCVLLVFAQLTVGALMRHYEAGLAITDLPLAYGRLLPPTDAAGLEAINQQRALDLTLRPVTLAQVWLHFGHRIGAVIVTLALGTLVVKVLRQRVAGLRLLAVALAVLLIVQLTLGVLTVLWRKPADIASAHVAIGALTLAATFLLALRALRVRSGAAGRQTRSRAPAENWPAAAAGLEASPA